MHDTSNDTWHLGNPFKAQFLYAYKTKKNLVQDLAKLFICFVFVHLHTEVLCVSVYTYIRYTHEYAPLEHTTMYKHTFAQTHAHIHIPHILSQK